MNRRMCLNTVAVAISHHVTREDPGRHGTRKAWAEPGSEGESPGTKLGSFLSSELSVTMCDSRGSKEVVDSREHRVGMRQVSRAVRTDLVFLRSYILHRVLRVPGT